MGEMRKEIKEIKNKLEKLETRFEHFETKVENAFETLICEVRITNNTLQGIWNIGDEILKTGSKQRKVSEMMSQAYEKAAEELKV